MPFDPLNSHDRYPPWLDPLDGHTAELPSGVKVGQLAQAAINHCLNWRYRGPSLFVPHQTSTTARNDPTGEYRIITYMPEDTAAQDRLMALLYGKWGYPTAAAYSLAYADPNDATNNKTIESATPAAVTFPWSPPEHRGAFVQYAETANANGFDWVRLITTNFSLKYLTGWEVPFASLLPAQVSPKLEDVAPGEVIAYLDSSMRGLIERMYDESDLVTLETIERMTRRCFFNWCCSGNTNGTNISAYSNIFDELSFPAVCRDLYSTQGTRYSYPAAIIEVTHATSAHGIRFRSTVTGNTWTYTVQGADPTGTPFLVTYDGSTCTAAGVSNVLGLPVVVENDGTYPNGDEIVVEGLANGSGHTTKVYAACLMEGAA